jgi:hypothetical protein
MMTVEATKNFKGPRGQVHAGQRITVADSVGISLVNQGLAKQLGNRKVINNKMKVPAEQPEIVSEKTNEPHQEKLPNIDDDDKKE